jgi:hypothetical protein
MIPVPTNLTLISSLPNIVSFQFTGAAGVDHYDVYRSTDAEQVGVAINVNPIPEPISPYAVVFLDDGLNTTSPPVGPNVYYYRAVAVDSFGNISLPSNALVVNVNLPQDLTPEQTQLVSVEERG